MSETAEPAEDRGPIPPKGEGWVGPLILVPAGIVAAGVALYLFMTWMLGGSGATPSEHLQTLVSGGYNARKQAAFELSRSLNSYREEGRLGELDSSFPSRLLGAYEATPPERVQTRVQLLWSLATIEAPEAFACAVDLLENSPADLVDQSPLETMGLVEQEHFDPRANALHCLGALGDPRGVGPITPFLTSSDAGLRMMAAGALGAIDAPGVPTLLAPLLDDPHPDVQRTTAVALAKRGSREGVAVLRSMLDRSGYADYTEEGYIEDAILLGLSALSLLGNTDCRESVQKLADDDPNPRIQSAARIWLESGTF